ncbi:MULTISPECIES: MFS transporter [Pseudofrankia]|uniref:MFS transporter n=1 Tax=Pseudofrankia TaxID=2994363 RepID=UPI000234B808|nr:hypothetical protein BCD49_08715 [Pseudofrankia sp. EUN1h]
MAATEMPGLPPGYRALLSSPGLRAVFGAHAVSMVGTVAAEVALSILVFQRTGSAFLSSLVLTFSFLPYAVGGTALSAVADRFPARRVLVACDLISAACVGAMLVPGLPIAGLFALLLVIGTVAPVFQGARAASLAIFLGPDAFPTGRSLLRTISQSALLAGMAAGSIALRVLGPTWLLAADTASFLTSAALLRLRSPATPAPAGERGGRRRGDAGPVVEGAEGAEKAEGAARAEGAEGGERAEPARSMLGDSLAALRYLAGTSPLRWLVLLGWTAAAFGIVAEALIVAYTVRTGASASSAGVLFVSNAAGAVLGEVVVSRFPPRARRVLLLPLALLMQLPLIAFAATPTIPVAAVLLAVAGTGIAFGQGLDALVVAATSPAARGRVFTLQASGLMAAQGAGAALGGLAGTFIAPGLVIAAAGALGGVCVLALARVALRRPVATTTARNGRPRDRRGSSTTAGTQGVAPVEGAMGVEDREAGEQLLGVPADLGGAADGGGVRGAPIGERADGGEVRPDTERPLQADRGLSDADREPRSGGGVGGQGGEVRGDRGSGPPEGDRVPGREPGAGEDRHRAARRLLGGSASRGEAAEGLTARPATPGGDGP